MSRFVVTCMYRLILVNNVLNLLYIVIFDPVIIYERMCTTCACFIAQEHARSHRFLPHLSTALPQIDKYMSTVWPAEVCWNKGHGFAIIDKTTLAKATAHKCPIKMCNHAFATEKLLHIHIRCGHTVFALESAQHVHYQTPNDDDEPLYDFFNSSYILSPPFPLPTDMPSFPYCNKHSRSSNSCKTCIAARKHANSQLPITPVKIYKYVKLIFLLATVIIVHDIPFHETISSTYVPCGYNTSRATIVTSTVLCVLQLPLMQLRITPQLHHTHAQAS
jgi:hypothetical protein